ALPGKRSRHNSSYWQGLHYLGLGPSAHSFNGNSRQWNIANNALYIQGMKEGNLQRESETLTTVQQLNEYIMTSLRTMEGLNLCTIETRFGEASRSRLENEASGYLEKALMKKVDDCLVLTREGRLFADGIAADLFDE
ncbi:MAG: coproporphyrinogen III oxidase, partial [Chitinophagaceae bacterium]|nr:coproporphyrinogen III oxidase [Chitinophagaceae bacterium]